MLSRNRLRRILSSGEISLNSTLIQSRSAAHHFPFASSFSSFTRRASFNLVPARGGMGISTKHPPRLGRMAVPRSWRLSLRDKVPPRPCTSAGHGRTAQLPWSRGRIRFGKNAAKACSRAVSASLKPALSRCAAASFTAMVGIRIALAAIDRAARLGPGLCRARTPPRGRHGLQGNLLDGL